MSPVLFKLCSYLRKILWILGRYPSYSQAFIESQLRATTTTTSSHELSVYRAHCTNSSKRTAHLIILAYLIYASRNLWTAYESVRLYDYEHFEHNIVQLGQQNNLTLKSIATCLLTNCTRLASRDSETKLDGRSTRRPLDEQLGEDASKLPIFSLCHPRIHFLFPPYINLDYFGIFFLALHTYTLLLLGLTTYLQQLATPAQSELIMYLAAPRLTCDLIRRRAREFVQNFANSYHNFRTSSEQSCNIWRVAQSSRASCFSLLRMDELSGHFQVGHNKDEGEEEEVFLYQNKTWSQLDELIENCLPIVRSNWWHKKLGQLSVITLVLCFMNILLAISMSFYVIASKAAIKEKLLQVYAQEMSRQNCFIWNRGERFQLVNLESQSIGWSWSTSIEHALFIIIPSLISGLMITHFYSFMIEAFLRLAELRAFLVATLMVTQLHNYQHVHCSNDERVAKLLVSNTRACFQMANLRRQFRKSVVVKFGMLVCSRHRHPTNQQQFQHMLITSTTNDHHQLRKLLNQIVTRRPGVHITGSSDQFNIESLEQIYVHFRLYVDHIHSLKPNFTIIMLMVLGIHYGYALIALICHHKLSSMSTAETLLIIMAAWMTGSSFIYFSAGIHSNSRKLHPLIWSIIGQLTGWKSTRARHLRALWVKQVVMLDMEGGLALTALGMRVTYGYIIKLILWTATVLVIVFKSD